MFLSPPLESGWCQWYTTINWEPHHFLCIMVGWQDRLQNASKIHSIGYYCYVPSRRRSCPPSFPCLKPTTRIDSRQSSKTWNESTFKGRSRKMRCTWSGCGTGIQVADVLVRNLLHLLCVIFCLGFHRVHEQNQKSSFFTGFKNIKDFKMVSN